MGENVFSHFITSSFLHNSTEPCAAGARRGVRSVPVISVPSQGLVMIMMVVMIIMIVMIEILKIIMKKITKKQSIIMTFKSKLITW